MDMPQPVNPNAYSYHTKAILRATKDVAESTNGSNTVQAYRRLLW